MSVCEWMYQVITRLGREHLAQDVRLHGEICIGCLENMFEKLSLSVPLSLKFLDTVQGGYYSGTWVMHALALNGTNHTSMHSMLFFWFFKKS